jgi:hypothetical protein
MLDQTAIASLKGPENRLIAPNLGAVAMTDNRCSRLANLARIWLSASDVMQTDTLFSATETPAKPETPSALSDSLRHGFEDYVATVIGGCFDDSPPEAFSHEGLGSKVNARDFWGFIDRYRGPDFAQLPLAMIALAHDDQSLLAVFEANFPDENFADVGGTSMLLVKWARARLGLKNQPLCDWQVRASTLPRRLSVRDVAVGAVAAIRIDLDRRPKNETIQLALDWDANVYFRWHLVLLDPTGAPIDDQNAPPLFAGSHLAIDARHLEKASAIVILGANIGEKWRVLDPQSPPHGFEASVW